VEITALSSTLLRKLFTLLKFVSTGAVLVHGILDVTVVTDMETAEILRLPTARKAQPPATCQPPSQRSGKKTESSDDTSCSQVIVTLPPTTEWQYRGRTGAEVQAMQPIQGPTDIQVQKDEGFQRFFKAVSSPGHVRVTAGGRIVPNTRGQGSPNHKKDSAPPALHLVDANGAAVSSNANGRPVGGPAQVSPTAHAFGQPPAGIPAAYPGYPAGMVPPPIPLAPISWGYPIPPGYAYPPGMPYPAAGRSNPVSTAGGDVNSNRATSGLPPASDAPGGIRISPPKQFDPVRPFFVNGQWVMPLPYPPYVMPPMMAPPGFYGHPAPGAPPAHSAAPVPSSGLPTPSQGGTGTQNPAVPQGQNTKPPSSAQTEAPSDPPISSIRPSQITKSHIESLRQNLKRVEDQLLYNVHQIDVKHMESLAKEIRDSIRALEQALPRQLEFEEMHYPKTESEEPKPNGELFSPLGSQRGLQHNGIPISRKKSSARGPAVSARRGKAGFPLETGFARSASSDSDAPRNFSGLPMTAAAAPVFQPSGQALSSSDNSGTGAKIPTATKILSPAGKNKQTPTIATKDQYHDGSGHLKHAVNGHPHVQALNLPTNANKRPYLVGFCPSGVDHTAAKQTGNFVYPRELTAEEIRARHLYWGQAPPSATKGLPKFDGKDFYPPSPATSREGGRAMAASGGYDASRANTTDPFSSGESRNAETHTRATSYSVSDEVDGKKIEMNDLVSVWFR
jgi:hypothetical protein